MTEQATDVQEPTLPALDMEDVDAMLLAKDRQINNQQKFIQQYARALGQERQKTATLEAAQGQLTGTIQAQNRQIAELEALVTEGPKTGQPESAAVEGDAAPEPVSLDTKRSRKKSAS